MLSQLVEHRCVWCTHQSRICEGMSRGDLLLCHHCGRTSIATNPPDAHVSSFRRITRDDLLQLAPCVVEVLAAGRIAAIRNRALLQ